MKNLKSLSFITVLIILAMVIFSSIKILNSKSTLQNDTLLSENEEQIIQSLNKIQELSLQNSADTISNIEERLLEAEQSSQIAQLKTRIEHYQEIKNEKALESEEDPYANYKFWIKVVFSFIFCLSALYVVLSKKYDDETKKWAYSVLTLIAGVWIGTISN